MRLASLVCDHHYGDQAAQHAHAVPHPRGHARPTLFIDYGACLSDGEMIRKASPTGAESYSVCFGPTKRDATEDMLKCDPHTFHHKRSAQYCCINPEWQPPKLRGQKDAPLPITRHEKVCADTMAQYEPADKTLKYLDATTCGPESVGKFGWGREFLNRCPGNAADYKNRAVGLEQPCRGDKGTLIRRTANEAMVSLVGAETGGMTYEFCPGGMTPIRRQGGASLYHTWKCEDKETKVTDTFSCMVGGQLHSVNHLSDFTHANVCNCDKNRHPANFL